MSEDSYVHVECDYKAFDAWWLDKYDNDTIVLNPREFAKEAFLAGVKYDDLEPRMP